MIKSQNLKKEGLLLLVSKYINEPTTSLLHFLRDQQLNTQVLIQNLNSNIQKGLCIQTVLRNQQEFGRNVRQQKQNAKWIMLKKVASKQLLKIRTLMIFVCVFFETICGQFYAIKEMELAGLSILITVILSFMMKIGARFRQLINEQQHKNSKNQKSYYVYRDSQKIEVLQCQIVVGDILIVDFIEPIPVTGILISQDQDIQLEQNLYGKNIQPKKLIEDCLTIIENKNELQLRIELELGRIPSPLILRGTNCTTSSWFRMLVICVQETQILEKCSLKIQKERGVSIVGAWINSITKLMRKITNAIFTFIFLFHVLAVIFKIKGLPKGNFGLIANTLTENIQSFLCILLLLDTNLLRDLLRGSYSKVINMLRSQKEVDNYLAVQQIFLTEESVFKYDKIHLSKVVLADLQQPVDVNLLPSLKPQQTYPLFYEIITGVNLGQDISKPQNPRTRKNTVIHKISYHQRIVTSLYVPEKEKIQNDQINQGDSISELLKTQGRMTGQVKNSNKITQSVNKNQKIKKSNSLKFSQNQEKQTDRNQQNSRQLHHGKSQDKSAKKMHLDDYLSKYCHFSAHSLVEGINVLAKNRSRTYCFQSYSSQRLSNVSNIWARSQFRPKDKKVIQHLLQNIQKMQSNGLKVYLIGFQEGVYPKKYVSNLFAAVGVQVTIDIQIQEKLLQLQKSGIKSTFIISEMQVSKQRTQKEIQNQLLKRSWIKNQNAFVQMQKVAQKGGRKLCHRCLATICKCRPKNQQLANPQGFLQIVNNVNCIWDVDQEDRKYLQLGYSQLNMGVIEINGFQQDTKKQLDQVFAAQELINALQQDVALWLAWLITVALCIFPFNYLTFDHIFSHSQIYLALIYFQALIFRHQYVGSSSLFSRHNFSKNKRKRQILGLALKVDLLLFLLLQIAGSYVVMSNPSIFNRNIQQQYPNYICQRTVSYYHNSMIIPLKCTNDQIEFTYYQKTPTFIYLYLLFAFTFRSALNVSQPFSKYNIIYQCLLLMILISLTYFSSPYLQFSSTGLRLIQLGACLGASFCVVLLCFIVRLIVLRMKNEEMFQFSSFLCTTKNAYSQLLKEFKFGKTSTYSLNKQECIQKTHLND